MFVNSAPRQLLPWERTWSDGTSPRPTPSLIRPRNTSSTPRTGFQRGQREVCHSLSTTKQFNFIMYFLFSNCLINIFSLNCNCTQIANETAICELSLVSQRANWCRTELVSTELCGPTETRILNFLTECTRTLRIK